MCNFLSYILLMVWSKTLLPLNPKENTLMIIDMLMRSSNKENAFL